MSTVKKYHRFLKEHPNLFAGGHNVYTPNTITDLIIKQLDVDNCEVLVLYNIEFVISLVYTFSVDPARITFYSDHANKTKIAQAIGVKYETELDNINMKTRPVLLVNPPYTNGEQDASEIYTAIIDRCITQFDPIAIGAVTPENLVNGGQKKKTLREKILKKYGLKDLRFLSQKRDWGSMIKVDTCFLVVEEGYKGPTTVVSRHFDDSYVVNTQLPEYIDGGNQNIHDFMLRIQTQDKVKLIPPKNLQRPGQQIKISKDYTDGYTVEAGNDYDTHNTEWRVAFGYLRCNTCAVVPPGPSIAGKYRYINFGSNEANARKFAKYMMSEPVRFIMKLIYTSRTLDNPQLAYVPWLDLNQFQDITDDILYAHWNVDAVTREQIASIVGNEVPF